MMETKQTSLNDLLQEFGSKHIPYSRLLETKEWLERRDKIVKRDDNCCRKCGAKATKQFAWDSKGVSPHFHFLYKKDEIGKEALNLVRAEKPIHLEVHHKYYMANKMPWEYPKKALITLCNWCHQELHNKNKVPFYSDEGQALNYTPCHRCNGSGSFPEYNHVQGGVCFNCVGARYEELIEK